MTDEAKMPDATHREICSLCHRVNRVGFHVPNNVWQAVVHKSNQNSIVCLECFSHRADEKYIEWDKDIQLFPVSLYTHREHKSSPIERGAHTRPTTTADSATDAGDDPQDEMAKALKEIDPVSYWKERCRFLERKINSLEPHPPAVAGDIISTLKSCITGDNQERIESVIAALTPPANADLAAVRDAVARMIEACEADTHPNDWRTAGDGTPLGDLRQALALLDRMMKREG